MNKFSIQLSEFLELFELWPHTIVKTHLFYHLTVCVTVLTGNEKFQRVCLNIIYTFNLTN